MSSFVRLGTVVVALGAALLVSSMAPDPAAARRCTIVGTAGSDHLEGTPRDDVICGKGGADRITGGSGADSIDGGSGRDRLHGGPGQDLLTGRQRGDRLYGEGAADWLSGGAAADYLNGGPGKDKCVDDDPVDRVFTCILGVDPAEDYLPSGIVDVLVQPSRIIDTSQSDQTVTAYFRIVDEREPCVTCEIKSGYIWLNAYAPSPGATLPDFPYVEGHSWEGPLKLIAGTRRDGIWAREWTFPRYTTPGRYRFLIQLDDWRHMFNTTDAQLEQAGLIGSIEQVGPGDMGGPTLSDLEIDPAQVDLSTGPATVRVAVEAIDDLLGFTGMQMQLVSPSGTTAYYAQTFGRPSADGTAVGTIELPQGAPEGAYGLEFYLSDALYTNWYGPAELAAMGLPHGVAVQSGP